jgi:hypothetical protein
MFINCKLSILRIIGRTVRIWSLDPPPVIYTRGDPAVSGDEKGTEERLGSSLGKASLGKACLGKASLGFQKLIYMQQSHTYLIFKK